MTDKAPHIFLSQAEFQALSDTDRMEYVQRTMKHLMDRVRQLSQPFDDPEKPE